MQSGPSYSVVSMAVYTKTPCSPQLVDNLMFFLWCYGFILENEEWYDAEENLPEER